MKKLMLSGLTMIIFSTLIFFIQCEKDEIKATKLITHAVDMSKVTPTTALITAEVIEKSDEAHGEYGFCWNTAQESPTVNDELKILGTNPALGNFEGEIGPLTPNTTYGVRAFVKVGPRYAYGPEVIFTTPEQAENEALPSVSTKSVENITSNSATVYGHLNSPGDGEDIKVGVIYSGSNSNPTADNFDDYGTNFKNLGNGDFSYDLINLTFGQTYYVRTIASSSLGETQGNVLSFTTKSNLPHEVATLGATEITDTTAVLHGEIITEGDMQVDSVGFVISANSNPHLFDDQIFTYEWNNGAGEFYSGYRGFTPNKTYYYRAIAHSQIGWIEGEIMSFTTEEATQTIEYLLDDDFSNNNYGWFVGKGTNYIISVDEFNGNYRLSALNNKYYVWEEIPSLVDFIESHQNVVIEISLAAELYTTKNSFSTLSYKVCKWVEHKIHSFIFVT